MLLRVSLAILRYSAAPRLGAAIAGAQRCSSHQRSISGVRAGVSKRRSANNKQARRTPLCREQNDQKNQRALGATIMSNVSLAAHRRNVIRRIITTNARTHTPRR